jgi:putative inorganic carbon (HCO3(-)) transporter
MRDILYGGLWLMLLPMSFYSAHIAVLLWMWVALLSPNELMYGVVGAVPFNKLAAASTFLVLFLGQQKKRFYLDGLIVLVAFFGIVVTLSYFMEEQPIATADLQYDKFWKELALFVLITGLMFNRHRLHQAALVVALGFGFMMAKEGIIFLFTAGGHKITGTMSTGDNNGLALAILMTIPFTLYAARYTAERWVRLVMQVTAGLGAVTVVATYSRGGFIGLIVLGIMMLQGSKYKIRSIVAIAIFGIVLYALMPGNYLTRVDTITAATQDDSFVTRLVAWKVNFLMALDHPFLGSGPYASTAWQNWSEHINASTTFLFPTPLVDRTYVAHSIYFQVLGDTGFTGLILFVLMLATAWLMAIRTRRAARKIASLAWAADLARANQISIVVYAVAGAALSLVYFELLYIVLALISSAHRTVLVELRSANRPHVSVPPRRALIGGFKESRKLAREFEPSVPRRERARGRPRQTAHH